MGTLCRSTRRPVAALYLLWLLSVSGLADGAVRAQHSGPKAQEGPTRAGAVNGAGDRALTVGHESHPGGAAAGAALIAAVRRADLADVATQTKALVSLRGGVPEAERAALFAGAIQAIDKQVSLWNRAWGCTRPAPRRGGAAASSGRSRRCTQAAAVLSPPRCRRRSRSLTPRPPRPLPQGFTVVGLLACAGRASHLSRILQFALRLHGPHAHAIRT